MELRELGDDELENRLAESRRELLNLRFQLATGQLDNVARIPQVRREVARVLTVLRERDIDVVEADLAAAERAPVLLEDARRRAEEAAEARAGEADAPQADHGDDEISEAGGAIADRGAASKDDGAEGAGEEEDQ
jgi:large subunit ribosomal protein L29